MFRLTIFFICLLFTSQLRAQDSLLIGQALQRITRFQMLNDGTLYLPYNFPSYITNRKKFKRKKQDDNIFFASLISFTLQHYYPSLSITNKTYVDTITSKITSLYPHFKNNKNRLTYNFWRTDTTFVFPYTNWIHKLKKNTNLPDDMDDTVLSLLAMNADSSTADSAHQIMQAYVMKEDQHQSVEKNYRSLHSYSVWYGKNFPAVYDVCVLSNILSFVQHYHLPWTHADSAALQIIIQSVSSRDFIDKPIYISPYYGTTSLILYHLARLMQEMRIAQLEELKPLLIQIALHELSKSTDLLQKIMLSSSLLKWGYSPPVLAISPSNIETGIEMSDVPFFTGNIPSYFPLFYKHLFTKNNWLLFYHYCPAFNDALLVEYLQLRSKP